MARPHDNERDREILRLRAEGLSCTAIARQLGCGRSTVFQTLRAPSNETTLKEVLAALEAIESRQAQLEASVEVIKKQMEIVERCLQVISQLSTQFGQRYKQEIVNLLLKWPSGPFKVQYFAGKL
jgi:IS30 family transposase